MMMSYLAATVTIRYGEAGNDTLNSGFGADIV